MCQSTISPACAFVCIVLAFVVVDAVAETPKEKSSAHGFPLSWIEKKIKEKIESFREVLRKGEPVLGIPIVDPYHLDSKDFNVNTSIVSASTVIRNLTVEGLSSYAVDNVQVSLADMSALVRLSWAGVKTIGEYNMDGVLKIPLVGTAPIYGKGTVRALLYKMWIESGIKFSLEDDEIVKASQLELLWETVNPQVRVDGLYGGQELSDTINRIIEDIIPKLDATYHDKVKRTLEQRALVIINDYLSGSKVEEEKS